MENIYKKLLEVQLRTKALKDQRNDFGKYNYRSAEGILEAVKPILKDVKATILLADEIINVGDRYYLQTSATFIDLEEDSTIVVKALAREDEQLKGMTNSQTTGATSSYARKYALNGLLLLDDNKDADYWNDGNNKAENEPKPTPKKATKKEEVKVEEKKEEPKVQSFERTPSIYELDAICKTKGFSVFDAKIEAWLKNKTGVEDLIKANEDELEKLNSAVIELIKIKEQRDANK